MSHDWRTEKLRLARIKYGKPFAHEVRVGRMTEPSHVLTHINQRSDQARESNVRPIRKEK